MGVFLRDIAITSLVMRHVLKRYSYYFLSNETCKCCDNRLSLRLRFDKHFLVSEPFIKEAPLNLANKTFSYRIE